MEHVESSGYSNVVDSSSIASAFWKRASASPDSILYRYPLASSAQATRVWKEDTYRVASEKISKVAHFLASKGVGPGTRVAIMSHSRPEWGIADLAIQTLGAITVSVYQSVPSSEVGFILYDSGAKIVFLENEEQAAKLAQLLSGPCPIPEREGIPASEAVTTVDTLVSFESVDSVSAVRITDIFNDDSLPATPPPVPPEIGRESPASIVYTSGTTGPPKGVLQTHGNHLSNVWQASSSGVFALQGSLFLYLPLAHSFARLIHYIGFLTSASLSFPAIIDHRTSKVDLASVAKDLREAGGSVVPSVPRLFEKMAAALQARAAGKSLQSKLLRWCISNARQVYDLKKEQRPLSIFQQIAYEGLAPIRAKVKRQLFGDGFTHGISGGAKLDPEVNRFFDSLGILILEGYGLTETCVATHVNLPRSRKIGTVGPAFEGVEVRIDPADGEILMRGPNVTKRYVNRPQATLEAWTPDGWFRSGDIGHIDEQGFLTITDRKKELIVTAGGKKIAPQSIEGQFKRCPFISQAFLFGDAKPYCVMLFTMNIPELTALVDAAGKALDSDQVSKSTAVRELLQAEINRVNATLGSFESIKRFAVIDEDFTIENGLLTPTLKVKRKKVVEKHKHLIDSLYI